LEPLHVSLESFAREGIEEYRLKTKFPLPEDVSLAFYPTWTEFRDAGPGSSGNPVYLEAKGEELVIHLCRELLRQTPGRVLKGWLQYLLAHDRLKKQNTFSPFNFSRQILPLFPVTGSAVNLVRQIVERMKNGLESFLTIRWIAAVGLGEEQVPLFSYRLKTLAGGMETYQLAIPHPWIRAVCLSDFLQHFLAVCCLTGQDLSAARDLKIQWWRRHAQLLREDQALLEEMALVPLEKATQPFPALLVELFLLLRSNLLSGPIDKTGSKTWH
jgi:hypothetical protein